MAPLWFLFLCNSLDIRRMLRIKTKLLYTSIAIRMAHEWATSRCNFVFISLAIFSLFSRVYAERMMMTRITWAMPPPSPRQYVQTHTHQTSPNTADWLWDESECNYMFVCYLSIKLISIYRAQCWRIQCILSRFKVLCNQINFQWEASASNGRHMNADERNGDVKRGSIGRKMLQFL